MIEICQHCFQVRECDQVGKIFLCNEHKDLKQYQPKEKKPVKIKPRSEKRSKQEREYNELRKQYLKQKPKCECCIQEQNFVVNDATEVHHKKGRIGSLLTDVRHFLAVCNECHRFIELNPEWAKENNYSTSRLK